MGLIGRIFGGSGVEVEEQPDDRYAILLNAGPDEPGAAANAFQYAIDLDDANIEVELWLDGLATKWPMEFNEKPNHPLADYWPQLQNRGLIAGACGCCACAFDAKQSCELSNVEIKGGDEEHAPNTGELAAGNYEILTVG